MSVVSLPINRTDGPLKVTGEARYAAEFQVPRVAKARNLPQDKVQAFVAEMTQDRFLGVLGEKRVNVLKLNLALDQLR